MSYPSMSPRGGRTIREDGSIINEANISAPQPNTGEALTVAGAGVVALTIPADTTAAVITNPVAIRIAFGVAASATVGTYFPAYACPVLGSAEQVSDASVYWTAAAAGAYAQYYK